MKPVELVSKVAYGSKGGIARYVSELFFHLQDRMPIRVTNFTYPPGSDRFGILHNFPTGIGGHQSGSIVHIVQIMGAAFLLWRPVHPSIVTVHDLGFLEWPEEGRMLGVVGRQLMRMQFAGLARADHLIAVSNFTCQGLIKHLRIPPQKITTIYQGIDQTHFHRISGARAILSTKYPQLANRGQPWLLFVGSEIPRKNLTMLCKAVQILSKDFPLMKMIKVGPAGGDKFRAITIKQIQEANIEDFVIFLDVVADEDLPIIYSAVDAYVHPSLLEGFGFPILEAMACGTPVVAASTGAIPEILQDAGVSISNMSPEELAKAVQKVILEKDLSQSYAMKGIEIANSFTIGKTLNKTFELYQNL